MIERIKRSWRGIFLFLAVMGPGMITASVDNDAGGITTYSVAGAHFGYSMLWSFIPIIIALIVVQEMCARMAIATGKGLSDLIREQFGVKCTVYSMIVLIYANLFTTISEFAGIAASAELLGISKFILVPVSALAVWLLIVRWDYKVVEKVFLFFCLFYVAYIFAAFQTKPDWGHIFKEAVAPKISWSKEYILLLVGVVGTTITPWMQFYQQASVVEKGVKPTEYKYTRIDVITGAFAVNIVAVFIVVVCANTLFQNGVRVETAQDAALALRPLAGNYSFYLFALGLLNASLFAASIVPLSTAYSVCEGLGWEVGVNKKFSEAPQFYTLYTATILIAAGLVLLPRVKLIPVMLGAQVNNGILLPFVLILMLRLANNKRLMGKYVNSTAHNFIAVSTIILLIGLSVFLLISYCFGNK